MGHHLLSASTIGLVLSIVSVIVYGVLIVMGLIFASRSGGILASVGLLVMLFGNLFVGWLASALGMWVIQLPSMVGMLFLMAGVAVNVQRHRVAQA